MTMPEKYPRWMNLYPMIDEGESLFHSGFLYGFVTFSIVSNVFLISNLYTNLGLLLGYLVFDQIIYRFWVIKRRECQT